jgi:hypothetical protein
MNTLSTTNAILGSCKCRAVSYRIGTDIRQVVNCHCNACRKMNGSAFSSYAVVPQKFFSLSGQENVAEFQIAEGMVKHCCKRCGSPVYNLNNRYPKYCMIYLGSLENSTSLVPSRNIYCESMLGWVEHIAAMEKYDQDFVGK